MKLLCLVLALVACSDAVRSTGGDDQTQTPGTSGSGVVETVTERIEASCIFEDDKLFLRRLAYVESTDGLHPDTYRDDYYGGIWQVDEEMYDQTKSASLQSYIDAINAEFEIDWIATTWEDLLKPLHSGLAARLYIQQSSSDAEIPRSISEQADFWQAYYRPGGDTEYFIQASEQLEQGCQKNGPDMVFVLDSSGSIGAANFQSILQFVVDVVNAYEIGLDKTRVAVMQYYGTSVKHEFDLDTYSTKEDVINAVWNIQWMTGGTPTAKALDALVKHSFQEANGARPLDEGHPRVGIVMTDGHSNNEDLTLMAAEIAHAADITMLAIGVGPTLNDVELLAIASEPTCLYLFYLGFEDLDNLFYAIEKRVCTAPIIIGPGQNGTEIGGTFPPGGDQNCKLKIPGNGATVKLVTHDGSSTFYVATTTYPSESYYEYKTESVPGNNGVMYIPGSGAAEVMMFCNIQGGNESESNVTVGIKPGDLEWCKSEPCLNGGECADQGDNFICICLPGYTGRFCEEELPDLCKPDPCQNGAECVDQGDTFVCICPPGYTGTVCEEKEPEECEIDPCDHGQMYCSCEPGYTGIYCDELIPPSCGFNCQTNSPCTPTNIENGHFYHPHQDPTKFIQCSQHGQCYEIDCPPGLVWDQVAYTCNRP